MSGDKLKHKKYSTLLVSSHKHKINKLRENVIKAKALGLKYKDGTVVEILRSSGRWQKATITSIDVKAKCYWVQFDAPGGKVSEKGIDFTDEKKYMRSRGGRRSTIKKSLPQLIETKRLVEEEISSLDTQLQDAVTKKDFISAGKTQEKLDAKNLKLASIKKAIEAAKEKAAKEKAAKEKAAKEKAAKEKAAKEKAAKAKEKSDTLSRSNNKSVSHFKEIKLSLEAEESRLNVKLQEAISKKDFTGASSIQADIDALADKITSAQRDLDDAKEQAAKEQAEKEQIQEKIKGNINQLSEVIRSLEAESGVIEKKLNDAITKKDFTSAATIQEELNSKQEKLTATKKELESAKEELIQTPVGVVEEIKGDVIELSQTLVSLDTECCLLGLQFNEAFIKKDFDQAERIKKKFDSKNAKLNGTRRGFETAHESLLEILETWDKGSKAHLAELGGVIRSLEDECGVLKTKFDEALNQKDCMVGKKIWAELEIKNAKLLTTRQSLKTAKDVLRERPDDFNPDEVSIDVYIIKKKVKKLQEEQKMNEEKERQEKDELKEKTRLLEEKIELLKRTSSMKNVNIISPTSPDRRRSSVKKFGSSGSPASSLHAEYKTGDTAEVQRSNGTWVQCKVQSVDKDHKTYRVEYGQSFKVVPFSTASTLMRAGDGKRLSTTTFNVNEFIELKRSNGQWTKAKVTSNEDSKYRCEYNNGTFKIIPYKDANMIMRKVSKRGSQIKINRSESVIRRNSQIKAARARNASLSSLRESEEEVTSPSSLSRMQSQKLMNRSSLRSSIKKHSMISSSPKAPIKVGVKSPNSGIVPLEETLRPEGDTSNSRDRQIMGYMPTV